MVMMARSARPIRRPAPRFPLTRVYQWKTVTLKVWFPAVGVPPGWTGQAPGL